MEEDKRISDLSILSECDGNELVPFAKNKDNGAVTTETMREYMQTGMVKEVTGKGLSSNDFTKEDKAKLDTLPTNETLNAELDKKQSKLKTTEDLAISKDNELSLTDKFKDSKLNKEVWDDWNEQFAESGLYGFSGSAIYPNSDSNYHRSHKIPINRKYDITVGSSRASTSICAVTFFDATGKVVSGVPYLGTHDSQPDTVTVPSDEIPENAVCFVASALRSSVKAYYSNGPTREAREGAISQNLIDVYSRISEIEAVANDVYGEYHVGKWNPAVLNADAVSLKGDASVSNDWHFVLIDCDAITGDTVRPVGELNPDNILRFKDGRFAPAVGITEDMRAECDVALYLDASANTKYCDAGEFDAEAFYNEHGVSTPLYDALGDKVRVLRPWETTETKYTIGITRYDTVYLLDQVIGKSGKEWKGLFKKPVVWDGIDVSPYALPPTAINPCPVTTVDGKARCFFFLYKGETNCASSKGSNNLCSMFDNGRTYPRTVDVSQISNVKYARANNPDPTKPYPCAEGGEHARSIFITSMELAMGSKNLAAAAKFSSGISSNDACDSEATWRANGGVRYKLKGSSSWAYARYNTIALANTAAGQKTHFNILLNNEAPKAQCMEAQVAYSYAKELGIAENTEFEFYGSTYWYVNVPDAPSGRMNARLYKHMIGETGAFNTEGSQVTYDIEVVLRMPLCGGAVLSGDIFMYAGGGSEQVITVINSGSPSYNNPVRAYIEPDQAKWLNDNVATKNDPEEFECESAYRFIGEQPNLTDNWMRSRIPYSSLKTINGGSLTTGQCAYGYTANYTNVGVGKRARLGLRFGFSAHHGICAPRSVHTYTAVSNANRHIGGSAQFLVDPVWAASQTAGAAASAIEASAVSSHDDFD